MAQILNKRVAIDPETGEVLSEKKWIGYDGFNDKGYNYRPRSVFIRYYFDSLPANYDKETLMLLIMIAELANEDNVLVYRIPRKSKFSSVIYKALCKEDIRERTRFVYGINKFDKCWNKLTKYALKRIQYYNFQAWAVNPAIVSKCKYVPFWLYEAFQDEMNPHLSALAINKLQSRIAEYKDN